MINHNNRIRIRLAKLDRRLTSNIARRIASGQHAIVPFWAGISYISGLCEVRPPSRRLMGSARFRNVACEGDSFEMYGVSQTSPGDNSKLIGALSGNPALPDAIRQLFVNKHVQSNLGEFSHIILLHGIYQEISRINSFSNRPLSSWVPCAGGRRKDEEVIQSCNREAEQKGTLSSWRNAALDCVDVLHWDANATIAKLAGAEHPAVLHLHFSRVVLLTPHESIRTLSQLLVRIAQSPDATSAAALQMDYVEAGKEVIHWAQRDEVSGSLSAPTSHDPEGWMSILIVLIAQSTARSAPLRMLALAHPSL